MAKLDIDRELIHTLAALLEETGLSEIELAEGDIRVRVARSVPQAVSAAPLPPSRASETGAAEPREGGQASSARADSQHPGAVTSPMVGTAYLAPETGAPLFVNVGDTVEEGDTLLIVEAMKTMNPIRALKSGKVTRILVENGAPVEYGEVLLILE